MEGDAVEGDVAFDDGHFDRIRRVDQVGLGIDQLKDALRAGHPRLQLGVELGQLLDRLEKAPDVDQEGDDNADCDQRRLAQGQVAAIADDDGQADGAQHIKRR